MSNKIKPSVSKNNKNGGFIEGVMVGTAIGATIYYLTATKDGKKLKRQLIEVGRDHFKEISKLENNTVLNKLKQSFFQANEYKQKYSSIVSQTISEVLPQIDTIKKTTKTSKSRGNVLQSQTGSIGHSFIPKSNLVKKVKKNVSIASKKVEKMDKQLKSNAKKIEKKFFTRKGRILKK